MTANLRRSASLAAVAGVLALAGHLLSARQRVVEEAQIIQLPGGPPLPRDATPQPTGTATVEGVVVSGDLGRPVRRATVRLSSTTPSPPLRTTTDNAGRFRFENVASGQFMLTASKPGYLESTYGQLRPGSGRPGTPLSVAAGQRIERLALPIARGGVLAGTVVDDGGEPAFGTEVRALRFAWQMGERVLQIAGSDKADDRGIYRIAALPPGEYLLMAAPIGEALDEVGIGSLPLGDPFGFTMGSRMVAAAETDPTTSSGYAPVYYPGTTAGSSATAVTLGLSEERAGLDLQLALVAMGRVAGIIASDGAASVAGTEVRLVNLDMPVHGFGVRATGTGPDGRFSFENVSPGRYVLRAHAGLRHHVMVDQSAGGQRVTMQFSAIRAEGPGNATLGMPFAPDPPGESRWAVAEVAVTGAETQTVAMVLQPGLAVSGRLAFDGTGQPPADPRSIHIVLNSTNQSEGVTSSSIAEVRQDGGFTIEGVAPGAYRVSVVTTSGWRPKSFDVAGRDALDFLLTVDPSRNLPDVVLTLTTRVATLSGTLLDAAGRPTPAHTIVLFADDPAYWTANSRRIHSTRPSTDGRFSVGNLPAGRYRLVAVDDLEDGQWFDPAVLQQLSGAALPITLGDGESRTQDIRVAR